MPPKETLPRSAGTAEEDETKEMRFNFTCPACDLEDYRETKAFSPPRNVKCENCGVLMDRVYGCQIDTSGCKDHNFVPESSRVVDTDYNYDKRRGVAKEVAFDRAIKKRRAQLADGGNKGGFKHTHSVPAELYHSKIKETGDKEYWKDPKNMKRHGNTRVDNG